MFDYTPLQIEAWLHFAGRRQKRRSAEVLSLHSLASQGNPKDIKKQLRELTKP